MHVTYGPPASRVMLYMVVGDLGDFVFFCLRAREEGANESQLTSWGWKNKLESKNAKNCGDVLCWLQHWANPLWSYSLSLSNIEPLTPYLQSGTQNCRFFSFLGANTRFVVLFLVRVNMAGVWTQGWLLTSAHLIHFPAAKSLAKIYTETLPHQKSLYFLKEWGSNTLLGHLKMNYL